MTFTDSVHFQLLDEYVKYNYNPINIKYIFRHRMKNEKKCPPMSLSFITVA